MALTVLPDEAESACFIHKHKPLGYSSFVSFTRFSTTELGQGGCPDTLVLLCFESLVPFHTRPLHSVLVWLLDSLGGKHTCVFEGFARIWFVS